MCVCVCVRHSFDFWGWQINANAASHQLQQLIVPRLVLIELEGRAINSKFWRLTNASIVMQSAQFILCCFQRLLPKGPLQEHGNSLMCNRVESCYSSDRIIPTFNMFKRTSFVQKRSHLKCIFNITRRTFEFLSGGGKKSCNITSEKKNLSSEGKKGNRRKIHFIWTIVTRMLEFCEKIILYRYKDCVVIRESWKPLFFLPFLIQREGKKVIILQS